VVPFRVEVGRKIRKNGELRGTPRIQVISAHSEKLGTMSVAEGLRLAVKGGLDLVEINPTSVPPTCKLIDMDKYKYEEVKKAALARRRQEEPEPE